MSDGNKEKPGAVDFHKLLLGDKNGQNVAEDTPVKLNPEWVKKVCSRDGHFDPATMTGYTSACRYLKPDPNKRMWNTPAFRRKYGIVTALEMSSDRLDPRVTVPAICIKKAADAENAKYEFLKDREVDLSRLPAAEVYCDGAPTFKVNDSEREKGMPDYSKAAFLLSGIKPTR